MSTLKSIFECKICHSPLSECVILPCGETVCREHTHSKEDLYCPSCKLIHKVPSDGFPLNKIVNLLFETNIHNLDLGDKFREAEVSCSKLGNSLELYGNLMEYPSKFLTQFFEELIDKLASKRDDFKLQNKIRCQNLLNELNYSTEKNISDVKDLVEPYLELADINLRTISFTEDFFSICETNINSARYVIDSLIDQSYVELIVEYKSSLDGVLPLIDTVRLEKRYQEEMTKISNEHKNFVKDLKILKIDGQLYSVLKQKIDNYKEIANVNVRRLKDNILLNNGFDLESKLFNFPNLKDLDFIQAKNQRDFVLNLKDLDRFEKRSIFGDEFLVNGISFYVGVKLEENQFGEIFCLGGLFCSNTFNFCGINVEYSMQLSPLMDEPMKKKSCIKCFSPGFSKLASLNKYYDYSQKEHKLSVHVKILSLRNRNLSEVCPRDLKKKQKKSKKSKSFGQNLIQVIGPDLDLDYQPD